MFDEDMPELPPVLEETLEEINKMGKKELREFARSILLNLVDLQEKHLELQRRYNRNSADYLSRCTSSGGITIPPRF
ncbi:hypothetical protein BZF66_05670 [Salmonella enterica]|uniref:hypothetical protein n=1 Tax=Salmonella enterica TaxID=28901 RepID=UPI000FDF86F5|nr:hypothetical protein CPT_Munch_513 [Salmonella phage Munch]EAZ2022780.1 hypothetical protein [Salmonella enterica]ECV9083914.1 hypothetical protein [Salmonella enterica subsp. enterica serovar Infantis]MCP0435487.1 hypothetical protein [Salmonella enterica subsp. enterica serovar Mbandaka]EHX8550729.1 hypothetical protein [Salmonella enterica]